jgi:tungstate transport system substrate-binding protein
MRVHLAAAILAALALGSAPAHAQKPEVTVGAPAAVLVQVVQDLGRSFAAQTGIAVKAVATGADDTVGSGGLDAMLGPARTAAAGPEQRSVFYGEGILVGSRADRARVRGLSDIRNAFRWIASARALYVSSSPSLGLRELELKLWDEVGVNVRVRSTWYTEVRGDEGAVFRQAAQWGAYALVQRATWAAQEDRRGLHVLVEGDPVLRTAYVSELLRPESHEARAWHDWLSSEQGQAAISAWRLNGVQVFTLAGEERGSGAPPRT